ncbi:MAG: twin-arginine translocase TatA/TatE family subunit, partial [Gracilibacteraceae bacterium]|nr:twin-arginine translocase TatA/TatE family subunit [Gracilibacteraceae bacterium]
MSMTGIVVILIAALLLFGPEEMPKIARTIGKLFHQAQKIYQAYAKDFRDMIEEPMEEVKKIEKGFTKSINGSLDLSSLSEVLEDKKKESKQTEHAGSSGNGSGDKVAASDGADTDSDDAVSDGRGTGANDGAGMDSDGGSNGREAGTNGREAGTNGREAGTH